MPDRHQQVRPGHVFMIGLPGLEIDESTRDLIRSHGVHNFILFRRNIDTPGQVGALCAALKEACAAAGLPAPIISIDQEGGQVARLPVPFTQFPDPRELVSGPDAAARVEDFARTCARELLGIGVNMNLAPVLDISPEGLGLFMERRSLGRDAAVVAELGCLLISVMQAAGLAACGKHFPGLGTAVLDPHYDLPVVERGVEELLACELVPFRAAATAGVAAIMTSHAVYSRIESGIPGTLSPRVVHDLVRGACGYRGLVITDDLEMGAIENFMDFGAAAVRAFAAGADLLLVCHDHDKVRAALEAVGAALDHGQCRRQWISASLARQQEVLARIGAKDGNHESFP